MENQGVQENQARMVDLEMMVTQEDQENQDHRDPKETVEMMEDQV